MTFGVFTGSAAGATVAVAPADLTFLRYKLISADTVVVDFASPRRSSLDDSRHHGITLELKVPLPVPIFQRSAPELLHGRRQSYSNDCVLVPDRVVTCKPGYVAVLNESTHKVVLLISSIPATVSMPRNLGSSAPSAGDIRGVHKGRFHLTTTRPMARVYFGGGR